MRNLLRIALIFAVLTAGVAACSSSSQSTKDQEREPLTEGDDVEVEQEGAKKEAPRARGAAKGTTAESDVVPIGDSPIKGPDTAPVTIVEFADYQCPFCKKSHETMQEIKRQYGDKIRVVYKHYPLPFHKQAEAASRAAIAAGKQGEFWDMHDLMFRYQKVMKGKSDEQMKEWAAGFAGEMGLDVEQFKQDFDAESTIQQVKDDTKLAKDLDVRGTPHFFVNGTRIKGAQPKQRFESVIDEELAAVEQLRERGEDPSDIYALRTKTNFEEPSKPKPRPKKRVKISYVPVDNDDPVTGATKDPLVTIVAFSDFQCPFCAKVVPTLERIEKEYGSDVRIVFKQLPLPFHKQAKPAAEIALAAQEQGKFWEMHDLLFERQRQMRGKSLDEMAAWGATLAKEIGIDGDKVAQSVRKRAHKSEIEAEAKLANKVGSRGTPNFWINGQNLVGAQPYPKFKAAIDEQLEIAKKLEKEKGLSGEALYKAAVEYNEKNAPEPPKADKPSRDKPAPQVDVSNLTIDKDQVKNAKDYDVTVFAFADYQCPYCSRGHDNLHDAMKKFDGKVRVVFKHYPLPFHKQAKDAAYAAMAAGEQGKFWEMSELLFANQKRFREDGLYVKFADKLGLDVDKFKKDMSSKKAAYEKQIKEDMKQGEEVGVRGTPAYFIGGERLVGAQPTEKFVDLLEKKADEK